MSNAQSFLTGFFGAVKSVQDENRQRANNYYDRQLEKAQTIGVERLQARRAKAAQADEVAQRLMGQGNIPPEVIKEASRGGLEGLGQLEEVWKSAASSNVTVDETFWRDVYSVAKQEEALSGQGIVPAIGSVVKQATTPPPEPEKRKRSVGDFIFGNDAVDRAAEKLAETEVMEGYSAADLLAMPDDIPSSTQGAINWSALSSREREQALKDQEAADTKERAARDEERQIRREERREDQQFQRELKGLEPLSVQDADRLASNFSEGVKEKATTTIMGQDLTAGTPEYEAAYNAAKEVAEEEALAELLKVQSPDDVFRVPLFREIRDRAVAREEQGQQPVQEAPTQPAAPSKVKPDGLMEKINIPGKGMSTFSHMSREGMAIYSTPEGGLMSVDPKVVSSPDKPAVETTAQGQATQARISAAINALAQGQAPEGFFIGVGEQAPQSIPSPEGGVLVLKQSIEEGFVYGIANDDSQDILIPKQ